MDEGICLICKQETNEGFGDNFKLHDPAYHVAYAYHKGVKVNLGPRHSWLRCSSCTKDGNYVDWPCETAIRFGVDKMIRSEL